MLLSCGNYHRLCFSRINVHVINDAPLKYDQDKAAEFTELPRRFFLLYEVLCHPRADDILHNALVYAQVDQ